jgi:hypothetical protein
MLASHGVDTLPVSSLISRFDLRDDHLRLDRMEVCL